MGGGIVYAHPPHMLVPSGADTTGLPECTAVDLSAPISLSWELNPVQSVSLVAWVASNEIAHIHTHTISIQELKVVNLGCSK